jgi:hypothetical protein
VAYGKSENLPTLMMNLKTKEIRKRTETLQHEDENWPPFNAIFENASTCIALLTEHETVLDISQ